MAKLQVTWTELASYRVTTGGNAADVQDLSTAQGMLNKADLQFERPLLVYLTSSHENEQQAQNVVESTTLKDERVSIASKFFTMVRDDGDQITKDHPYYKWIGGQDLPRFVVFTADGDKVGKIEGRASPSKLYDLMKKAITKDYVVNLDRTIKDYQKILTSLDRLSVLKSALSSKEGRTKSKSEQSKIEREKEALAKEEEELRAREEDLLKIKKRDTA
ncbi:MAG: hypothetical protein V2A76_09110 [Planctomycetota bacterium]